MSKSPTGRRTAGVIYLSNARIPSEKANTKQSMHQCEALGRLFDLEFWYPSRHNPMSTSDPHEFYGVDRTFRLRQIPSWDSPVAWRWNTRLAFLLQSLTFLLTSTARLLTAPRGTIVYTRNQFDLLIAPLLRGLRPDQSLFFEDHDGILRRFSTMKELFLRAARGIVVTTTYHAQTLSERGVAAAKILVCPNAVGLAAFTRTADAPMSSTVCKVVYAGNLFPWKGVHVLAQAARLLPDTFHVHIVGGSPEASRPFEEYLAQIGATDRVNLVGYVPPVRLPTELMSADVLVLPNSGRLALSDKFTSPLKLFEYMAAGRPIVASNVPAIASVLTDRRNAILVEPDNPQALADGIRLAYKDVDLARRIAAQARVDVEAFTWDRRARRIADFFAERGALAV